MDAKAESWRLTAVCIAVSGGHHNLVKFLIDQGAAQRPDPGVHPIVSATQAGDAEMVELLCAQEGRNRLCVVLDRQEQHLIMACELGT